MSVLTIENHGVLITASNFWETEAEAAGKFFLSTNAGAFQLGSSNVVATAGELNILHGATVTASGLNAMDARVSAVEARGITNTTLAVTVGALTTTGAVSFAAGSLGSAALAYGKPYTTQTVAGVFTNVYDAKGLNVSHNP